MNVPYIYGIGFVSQDLRYDRNVVPFMFLLSLCLSFHTNGEEFTRRLLKWSYFFMFIVRHFLNNECSDLGIQGKLNSIPT